MTKYILIGLGIYLLIQIVYRLSKKFSIVKSRWQHIFDGVKFSSQDFYQSVEEIVASKEMKYVSISRTEFDEESIYAPSRQYLRITREESMFLICAAPFGTGFFVSWWYGEPINWAKELVLMLPIIGFLAQKMLFTDTYYRQDTDAMFTEMVKHCVKEAIENMTVAKGVRKPTELEYKETRMMQLSAK
ncbi:MAG: hypothetical protein H6551_09930 [Chitinophagales bacterium]|nr:hypothetical protein [Chitinophagales bacterium]